MISYDASGADILDKIRRMGLEKVYPVHTQHKEVFDCLEDDGIEIVYPNLSK